MRRLAPLVLVVVVAAVVVVLDARRPGGDGGGNGGSGPPTSADAWAALEPEARCESALALIAHPTRWPLMCRWRGADESLVGQAFPPPAGPPPFDRPRVEIYLAPEQSRDELAAAIAHEFGHMHHTREPTFAVADYLAARNLPPATPTDVWTEDYAEVFAALFAPPQPAWRAPTPRPSPGALADLKARFFAR